jgi:cadmium resistance protein CadD (predicted permease)
VRLTPPTYPVFLIAMVLGLLSIASRFTRIPTIGHYVAAHQYWMLAAAFLVLAAGVIFSGL